MLCPEPRLHFSGLPHLPPGPRTRSGDFPEANPISLYDHLPSPAPAETQPCDPFCSQSLVEKQCAQGLAAFVPEHIKT